MVYRKIGIYTVNVISADSNTRKKLDNFLTQYSNSTFIHTIHRDFLLVP